MSTCLSKKLLVLVALAVSSCSLAFDSEYRDLQHRLTNAHDAELARAIGEKWISKDDDPELFEYFKSWERAAPAARAEQEKRFKALLETRALADEIEQDLDSFASNSVKEQKRRTGYSEAKTRPENFIARAMERLKNLAQPNQNQPRIGSPRFDWLLPVAWIILGLLATAFLIFAILQIRWRFQQRRRATALLEADEPAVSADEYLERADELARQGKAREAVRCLYLACLLRLDEGGIAKFVGAETNWEHYRRISASPRKPSGLDFRAPTRAFDQVWYGFRTNGMADVEYFRDVYRDLLDQIRGVPRL